MISTTVQRPRRRLPSVAISRDGHNSRPIALNSPSWTNTNRSTPVKRFSGRKSVRNWRKLDRGKGRHLTVTKPNSRQVSSAGGNSNNSGRQSGTHQNCPLLSKPNDLVSIRRTCRQLSGLNSRPAPSTDFSSNSLNGRKGNQLLRKRLANPSREFILVRKKRLKRPEREIRSFRATRKSRK